MYDELLSDKTKRYLMSFQFNQIAGALAVLGWLTACSDPNTDNNNSQASETAQSTSKPPVSVINAEPSSNDALVQVVDFENLDKQAIALTNVSGQRVSALGVSEGKYAYQLTFDASEPEHEAVIKAKTKWDWSKLGNINLALDINNPKEVSAFIYLVVIDHSGKSHRRGISIPANSTATYYALLKGPQLDLDSGLREDPKSWPSDDKKMFWLNGNKQLDLANVKAIKIEMGSTSEDKTIVVDNIRIRQNPSFNTAYLEGLADKFGQNAKFEFAEKVKSDSHIKALAEAEIAQLNKEGPMADRTEYGGWKSGPRLEATGYFRTEKYKGKWWIVDPEGALFFSSALANIRIANTTTLTGIDFKDDSVRYRDPEDVTPEDSLGIRPVSKAAQKTRYIASEVRHKMFNELPDYDDPLANHYSYRRSTHKGPLPHGETFSFYQANLERRYGETYPDSYLDTWRDVTIKRFKNWGFTSTGNWTDASYYQMNRIPYFANGWIIGDYKTVESGGYVWSPMPDPFDPEFKRRAELTTQVIAEEVKNNPWCIGVFVDNEKSWGNVNNVKSHYSIPMNTMGLKDSESPTKAVFTGLLKDKYADIKALNKAWETAYDSWQVVEQGVEIKHLNDAVLADMSSMLYTYAEQYFKIVHDALEKVLPNHMYMGVRLTMWGKNPEVIQASKKYVDIMSYNSYREILHEKDWAYLAKYDKPSIIGEFHMGANSDTGLYHPGLIHAEDQKDRARMYQLYMHSAIDNPYIVGAHWFQYLDSPLTGRAYDGENYNTGFVTIADIPYKTMVNKAKEINSNLYPRRMKASTD